MNVGVSQTDILTGILSEVKIKGLCETYIGNLP